jgi:predicted ThiF/HesA family dinucleotide-utilizing enzyme
LVHGIPYVNSRREVVTGTLISTLTLAGERTQTPDTHVAYFAGEHPCNVDGTEISQIKHGSSRIALGEQLTADHSFSSKPKSGGYKDYYEKMVRYATIISSPAFSIKPDVTAKTFRPVGPDEEGSVFTYLDTASSRAGISALTAKLAAEKIAIVGLGGTGSYILDLVAKTPVREIHLFDGDRFLQHNAFRAPGAATLDELKAAPYKVDYLKGIYSKMHSGISAHSFNITEDNADELRDESFVFVCIDGGATKKAVVERLEELGVPFIDTGMGIEIDEDALLGVVRVTTSTNKQRDHFRARVSMADGATENLYRQNIQIADLNALNAALAVIKWKKLRGFYLDLDREHHSTYTTSGNLMTNDVKA